MTWVISDALALAQLQATLDRLLHRARNLAREILGSLDQRAP